MNIIRKLAACTTEEEVKAQYVRWLGIKGSIRNKVDFQSEGVLWEFKYLKNMQSSKQLATVMGQVTYYLRRQQRLQAGEQLPGLVVLADKNEAVVFQSQVLTPFFELSIDWRKAASSPDRELIKHLEPLAKQTRVFDMTNAVEAQAFADALKTADGSIVQRIVTIDNFEQAYVHWCELIGRHFSEADRGLAFMGDLTARATDTQYDVSTGVLQILQGQQRMQAHVPVQDYQKFWTIWHRPPAMADYQRMLAHVDRLRAIGDRRRTGAFFTPLPAGKLALEYIARELGEDWQDRYWVWDPACGSGNLTYYMDRYDRCFLSTIDQSDVDFVNQNGLAPEATVFQYDFCTDDVEKLAAGDAWISAGWKMPLALRQVLEHEPDKLVILMNPPYAECGSGASKGVDKAGVAETIAKTAFGDAGKAQRELYTQFLLRCNHHKPALISAFSTLKLTNTDGYEKTRGLLQTLQYGLTDGFIIPSWMFHGTKGKFPVGFHVLRRLPFSWSDGDAVFESVRRMKADKEAWNSRKVLASFQTSVPLGDSRRVAVDDDGWVLTYDGDDERDQRLQEGWINSGSVFSAYFDVYQEADGDESVLERIGQKWVGPTTREVLNKWPKKEKPTVRSISLSTAIKAADNVKAKDALADGAVGFIESNANDVQHVAAGTVLYSAASSGAQGWSVTPDNFRKSIVIFTVRKVVKKTWLNDRDQFTIPAEEPSDEFYNDCLVYALFHGSNQTSSLKDVEYKGQVYQVRNQFLPYNPQDFLDMVTEPQWYNQLSKAKPVFVGQYLKDCQLSPEAQQLLDNGHLVYQHFYRNLPRLDRQQYRLDYWDAGWYQVRKSLELAGLAGPELQAVRDAHRQLEAKITPQVYSLGFLRP